MKMILVDLDDTLTNLDHRKCHYGRDWDLYNELMINDKLNYGVYYLVKYYHRLGFKIVIATGRYEKYRELVEKWLRKYNIKYHELWMKPDWDTLSSVVWKCDMIFQYSEAIDLVIDDRSEIRSFSDYLGIRAVNPLKLNI